MHAAYDLLRRVHSLHHTDILSVYQREIKIKMCTYTVMFSYKCVYIYTHIHSYIRTYVCFCPLPISLSLSLSPSVSPGYPFLDFRQLFSCRLYGGQLTRIGSNQFKPMQSAACCPSVPSPSLANIRACVSKWRTPRDSMGKKG